jgi:hypothetical protein
MLVDISKLIIYTELSMVLKFYLSFLSCESQIEVGRKKKGKTWDLGEDICHIRCDPEE